VPTPLTGTGWEKEPGWVASVWMWTTDGLRSLAISMVVRAGPEGELDVVILPGNGVWVEAGVAVIGVVGVVVDD
jgi:hypothetical protein